jgi:hypothetical protein
MKISFSKKNLARLSILMIFIMVFGSYLGYIAATDGGAVAINNVTILGSKDNAISGLLFRPSTATRANPAPAVMLAYGGTGFKDFMSNTAIELARHGYVALEIDTSGSGFTQLVAGGWNTVANDSLNWLRGQSFVNASSIGLVGMSMGRQMMEAVAAVEPTWYKSMFYMGMDSEQDPQVFAKYHNAAWSYGIANELSDFLDPGYYSPNSPSYYGSNEWNAPYWYTELLAGLNIANGTMRPNVVYGNIAAGTGRMLYQPWADHAQTTESTQSVMEVINWESLTLAPTGTKLAQSDESAMVAKQFFLSISFVAMFAFIFLFGESLLKTEYFLDFKQLAATAYKGFTGKGYWLGAIITTALGPLLFLQAWIYGPITYYIGNTPLLPEGFPNDYANWMLVVAAVTAIILVAVYFLRMRKAGFGIDNTGLGATPSQFLKSAGIALLIVGILYLVYVDCYAAFKLPITLSGLQIEIFFSPLTALRFPLMLNYFLVYLPFYLVFGVLFFGFMRYRGGNASLSKEMIINSLILAVGPTIMLLLYYVPLYANMAPLGNWNANQYLIYPSTFLPVGIPMIYLITVPVFNIITACTLTYFNRKTGNVWLGVLIMTLLFTWMQVSTGNLTVPIM